MSLCLTKCYLENINDPDKKINLPHKIKVPIGTKHFPLGCPTSAAHVFAVADVDEMTVVVENVSNGTAWYGKEQLNFGSRTILREGDHLALEDGKEIFVVRFQAFQHAEKLRGVAEAFKPTVNFESQNKPTVRFEAPLKVTEKKYVDKAVDAKRCDRGQWKCIKDALLIYTPAKLKSSTLIAGFSLIGTLVKVSNSKRRCQWKLTFANIPDKLKGLQKNGYKITVFTENVLSEKLHLNIFKRKMATLMRRIGVPMQVFVSVGNGKLKKPMLGMWSAHAEQNKDHIVNKSKSFYVGCLGGRKENWAKKKTADASNADRLFAVNIGVKFFTPEEYFCGTRVAPYRFPKFNPREPCMFNFKTLTSGVQELVVMVGAPDSGKTWTCKTYLIPAGYVHITINFTVEMLRSKPIIKDYLKQGKSIVIDGMNPSEESRCAFVNIAKKRCIKVRCFEMQVSCEQLAHNMKFRQLTDMKDGLKEDARILTFDSFYQKPDVKEGFNEIVHVPFAPSFKDVELDSLYHSFLLPD